MVPFFRASFCSFTARRGFDILAKGLDHAKACRGLGLWPGELKAECFDPTDTSHGVLGFRV